VHEGTANLRAGVRHALRDAIRLCISLLQFSGKAAMILNTLWQAGGIVDGNNWRRGGWTGGVA
jgi:hypothetical protein